MKTLLLPVAMLLALASAPVVAGEPGAMPMHACPMHDASLSAEERAKAMDSMFAMLDADKDGSISRAEFDAHHAMMRAKHDATDAGEHKH